MNLNNMDTHNQITTYSPKTESSISFASWKNMVVETWKARDLTFRFFLREIYSRYRQSFFGYIWAILPAIAYALIFTMVKRKLAVGSTDRLYPAYVLTGITCWQLFSIGLVKTTQSLAKSQSIITKINFCRETLVFAAFAESVFDFIIRLLLIIIVFIWFGITPHWTAIFVPLILLSFSLFVMGIGFFLTLINGIFRDVGNTLNIFMSFAMLMTPSVYYDFTNMSKELQLLDSINPVSPFILSIKELIFIGSISRPVPLCVMSSIGICLFFYGWHFFRIAMPRIAERV